MSQTSSTLPDNLPYIVLYVRNQVSIQVMCDIVFGKLDRIWRRSLVITIQVHRCYSFYNVWPI